MWVYANPNPCRTETEDCVVRAISIASGQAWEKVHMELCEMSREKCTMPSVNWLWGEYLKEHGFKRFQLPKSCPHCISVRRFCQMYPKGVYILGTGHHAVAAIDGNYYDTFDSGDEVPICYWKER